MPTTTTASTASTASTVPISRRALALLLEAAEGYGLRGWAEYLEHTPDDDTAELALKVRMVELATAEANQALDT